jgi:hypothetical protein
MGASHLCSPAAVRCLHDPSWRELAERVIRARRGGVTKDEMTTTRVMTQDVESRRRSPLASGSLRVHLFRGAAGVVAAVLAIVLVAVVGPVSLVLLAVTAVAWRGCPTCWTAGLLGTLADDRARRSCSRC